MYCERIMKERLAQKMKQTIKGGDANESIFVAKRFSAINFKRENSLTALHIDSDLLFGRL